MRSVRFSAIAAFILLSGCAASIPPVEVTRFHAGASVAPGAVALVPLEGGDPASLEFRSYAAAVAKELSVLGYREGQGSATAYVAEVDIARSVREEQSRRSPVTIGIGGGSFGRGGGIGIGTSFGVGGNRPRETVVTKLSVRLKARADGMPFWEGRAETSAASGAPAAQPGIASAKLANALFRGFPGKSGETIVVP
jgi:hypothetical protein